MESSIGAVLDQGLFISLLNPALSAVLSAAFFVFWLLRRGRRHILQLCLCYLCIAVGFVLQGFNLGLGFETAKLLSNLLFFTAVLMFASALIDRVGLPVPVVPLIGCATVGMALFTWFLLVEPNFAVRVFAVNYGLGAMCAIATLRLRQSPSRATIDRLLVWLAGLRALDFFVRPAAVALLDGGDAGQAPYITSAYWLTTSLSVIIFSLLIALTLLTALALDIMQELRTESRTDVLSGLLNRRGFEEKAAPYFDDGKLGAAPLGLLLADLDHFKAVNDVHGHGTGDAVIAAFARLLRQAGAGRAIIGRIGGEEFAVLVPYCDLGGARLLAEGVRSSLAMGALDGIKPDLRNVTCSFGVAGRVPGERFEDIFQRADDALMQAKRAGRNRVQITYLRPDLATAKADPGQNVRARGGSA